MVFSDDISVYLIELQGPLSGQISDSGIGVHPTPARAQLHTVQVIIELGVANTNGMGSILEDIIQDVALSQSNRHDMRSSRESSVKVIQNFKNVGLEVGGLSHGTEGVVTIANIITDELENDKQGVVIFLISSQSLDIQIVNKISASGTVNTQVLVISMVAFIVLSHVLVD